MESEAAHRPSPPDAVVAAVDAALDGDHLIIADITQDNAWVSTPTRDAVSLSDWC